MLKLVWGNENPSNQTQDYLVTLEHKIQHGGAVDAGDLFDVEVDEQEKTKLEILSGKFRVLAGKIKVEQDLLDLVAAEAQKRFRMFVAIAIAAAAVLVTAAVIAGVVLSGGIAAPLAVAGVVAVEAAAASSAGCGAAAAVLALSISGAVASFGVLSASTAAAVSCRGVGDRTQSLQKSYDQAKEGCRTMAIKITALNSKLNKLILQKKIINTKQELQSIDNQLCKEISKCIEDQDLFITDLNDFDETITKHEKEYLMNLISVQTRLERPVEDCILV